MPGIGARIGGRGTRTVVMAAGATTGGGFAQ